MKEKGIKMSKYSKITRESMNSIIEEIMGIFECDWISANSKSREIERALVDAGIGEVIDEPEEGLGKYVD